MSQRGLGANSDEGKNEWVRAREKQGLMECSLISPSSDLSREFADSLTDAPGRPFAPRKLGLGLIFHSW